MEFTVCYKEVLSRTVIIKADTAQDAVEKMRQHVIQEDIVLGAEDFAGGTIELFPCKEYPNGFTLDLDY